MLEHVVGAAHQRIFLAEHIAILADDGQAVNVGIDHEAYIGLLHLHFARNLGQVLWNRLWSVGELAVRCAVQLENLLYAECLKQGWDDDAAHRVDAVAHHAEAGLAYGLLIDQRQFKHLLDVVVRVVLLGHLAELVNWGEREVALFGYGKHLFAGCLVEEFALVVQQLERVPLDRVVACGEDEAAVGLLGCHGDFGGRSCGQSDVDDVEAHADQCARDALVAHFARQSGIAANDDAATLSCADFLADDCGIGRSELDNVERVQTFARLASDCATDAGN